MEDELNGSRKIENDPQRTKATGLEHRGGDMCSEHQKQHGQRLGSEKV